MNSQPEAQPDARPVAVPAEPGSPAWWQARYAERERRRPRQGGLTLDRITAGALELADREGLEALTMRRLGEHLQVRHTSLYRHVASREELLIETVDHMLGEIRLPSLDGGLAGRAGGRGPGVPPGARGTPGGRPPADRRTAAGPQRAAGP
ncbi:hypothetical protein GCM10020254_75750 [Streptomyces goshikiensis]